MSLTKLLLESTRLNEFSPIYKKIQNKKGFQRLIDATSFSQLRKIGMEEFKPIGSGSSRIAFNIEDLCALKVAKNSKGEAQNELECDIGSKGWYDVVAKVFACTDNNRILLMEHGKSISFDSFNNYIDIDDETLETLFFYLNGLHAYDHGKLSHIIGRGRDAKATKKQVENILKKYQNELNSKLPQDHYLWSLEQLFRDFQMHPYDFARDEQWALVNRDGKDIPVLIDFGLSDNVFDTHYSKN